MRILHLSTMMGADSMVARNVAMMIMMIGWARLLRINSSTILRFLRPERQRRAKWKTSCHHAGGRMAST
jgi:hypothetical protein